MGSRKRLVLASLVSLMMAVAFIIGLMPLHGALTAKAAVSGPGRTDMVDLLNAVLNIQVGDPATEIAVTFPFEGADFIVPDTTAEAYINVESAAVGDATPVAYAIDPDLTSGELDTGSDLPFGYALGFNPPDYKAVLNVTAALEPTFTSLSLYAFANAAEAKQAATSLVYSVRSGPTNFSVTKVSQTEFDADKNGLPNPLNVVIQNGQQWRASYLLFYNTGEEPPNDLWFDLRNVAVASLNNTPVKQPYDLGVTVSPEPGVFVTAPGAADLVDAGLMNEDEQGYLIVNSSLALQLTVDDVYGLGNDDADIAAWANGVQAVEPPGDRVPWEPNAGGPSPYVEIALLAIDEAADTYREIEELPDTLPVVLELDGLVVDGETPVQLWSYPSWLQETAPESLDFFFQSVQAAVGVYEWEFIDQQVPQVGESFEAELTSLSIFGAFASAMQIDSVYPNSAQTCVAPGEVTISGDFGLSVPEDLNERFDVFFGDQVANIISATELYDGLIVEAPLGAVPGPVDVSVVDATVPASLALLEQAFTYYDVFTLSLTDPDGGSLAATPEQDSYLAGDVVNLVATADAGYTFVQWQGDVGDVADVADPTTTLTFDRDVEDTCDDLSVVLTAEFQYAALPTEYFLVLSVAPADAGVVEVDDVEQPLGVELGPFAPGETIDLNAIEDTCYDFDGWIGPVANASAAETTLTFGGVDATIEVTATFVPVCYFLTIVEDPDAGGDVDVEPFRVPPQYTADESVTLTATPNTAAVPAYQFVQWVINNTDTRPGTPLPGGQNQLVLDFSEFAVRDITVRAVFRPNPILTILETEGGTVEVSSVPDAVSEIQSEPDRIIEYLPLTVVTLEAVAGTDFEFVQWAGDVPEEDRFDPIITLVMDENKTVQAIFSSTNFLITDITPDQAWIFGGVVANIRGTGFMPGSTQLFVYGVEFEPLEVTATDVWFVVPPLQGSTPSQVNPVNVTLKNPPYTVEFTQSVTFNYLRYATEGNVTTTAFRYAGTTADIAVALGSDLSQASLLLPPPQQAIAEAYGLVRATTVPAAIEADEVNAGTDVPNAWNFGIHLYNPTVLDVGLNTGAAVHAEITNWTYARAESTIAAQLEYPLTGTGLDAADIRTNVMMWSVDTRYDYGEDVTTLVSPVSQEYQSTLEQAEVTPNVAPEVPDGATLVTAGVSRLYDLTSFALQTGVPDLPAEFVDAMTIEADAEGPSSGGTQFVIDAPLGGLAWVTVGFGENITPTTPASATVLGTVIDNGATEFSAIVQTPEWPDNEDITVDVAVYLNSNLNEPLIIFENGFRYTETGGGGIDEGLLLLLLGLAAALIGLAAGGDSGDGGGPCFIATAAYGTPMAADIDTLRDVRDTYLLESAAGTAFVDAYYRLSPTIASVVAQSPVLAAMVRLLLLPVIFMSKLMLTMPAAVLVTLGVAMLLVRIRRRGKAKA